MRARDGTINDKIIVQQICHPRRYNVFHSRYIIIMYSLANELSDGFIERTSAAVQTIDEICWTRTADQRPQGCRCKTNETCIRIRTIRFTAAVGGTVGCVHRVKLETRKTTQT